MYSPAVDVRGGARDPFVHPEEGVGEAKPIRCCLRNQNPFVAGVSIEAGEGFGNAGMGCRARHGHGSRSAAGADFLAKNAADQLRLGS